MDMLGASVLFTRGNNIHNQLSDVVAITKEPKFISMLKEMNLLYTLENTRANRESLQAFIIKHGDEIYVEFSKRHLSFGQDNFGYDLKN